MNFSVQYYCSFQCHIHSLEFMPFWHGEYYSLETNKSFLSKCNKTLIIDACVCNFQKWSDSPLCVLICLVWHSHTYWCHQNVWIWYISHCSALSNFSHCCNLKNRTLQNTEHYHIWHKLYIFFILMFFE
jgi:hypothetical protein